MVFEGTKSTLSTDDLMALCLLVRQDGHQRKGRRKMRVSQK
jgi:hypothetical protein